MGRVTAPISAPRPDARVRSGRRPAAHGLLLAALSLAVSPAALLAPTLLTSTLLTSAVLTTPVFAQTLNDRLSRSARNSSTQQEGQDRLLVDAKEFVYDKNADTITARGDAQLFYQGRALQADSIIYNRNTKRVFAQGRAKLTERDGTIAYGDKFELTDDFRDGFINSLRGETVDRTTFTAGRAERIGGESTVFVDGSYTACEACKDDPSKPPLWRVRAKRIIHKNSEQTIYYEDATFELWGQPIAWLPFFSSPDHTVERKSGLLPPRYIARSTIGAGVSLPIYWALAPNYDITVTPTVLSRQGLLGTVEWRHKLLDGSYDIRASGIFQQAPEAFLNAPLGPGNMDFRGSIESRAKFNINQNWRVGWDVTILSDRWFLQDYKLPNQSLSSNFFKESISTVYLNGQANRGYFDLRGYRFEGLSRADVPEQQPLVGVLDYNKTFDVAPERSGGIGGQVEIDLNITSISRDLASFEAIGGRKLDRAYNLFDVCETATGVRTYNPGNCLLRGMGGNYGRATANLSWKRQYIDPIGQVWTPFVFTHANGTWLNLDETRKQVWDSTTGQSFISNADQFNFFGANDTRSGASLTPGVGLEYRMPLIGRSEGVTHVVEPIVQLIARPNTDRSRTVINEDAQSLVFDDTNLFQWSKFSGYDRFEGGTRANYGVQYTARFDNGGFANVLVGQSYQVWGENSYARGDAANIGLSSGLDTRASDYVARAAVSPNANFNFIAKGRFDPETFDMRRLDLIANMKFGSSVETSLQYARYEKQPLIGFDKRREGFASSTRVKLNENIFVSGDIIVDMSRHLYTTINNEPVKKAPLFSVAGLGIGAGYTDECTTLAVNYTSILRDNGQGTQTRNQTVTVQLQLRTLGDTRVRSSLGEVRVPDGLSASNAR